MAEPHILFVSQKVTDIKVSPNSPELAQKIGELREYLHGHKFIPADKVTGELMVTGVDAQGNLECKLTGSSLGKPTPSLEVAIHLKLPLGLIEYGGEIRIQDILTGLKGTSIDDGGNIQNMLINTLILAEALSGDYPAFNCHNLQITVVTSTDPFKRLDQKTFERHRNRVNVFELGIRDRVGIHFPYDQSGRIGTLGIISEAELTDDPLLALLKNNAQFKDKFGTATCFVSADPLFQTFYGNVKPPYAYVINASTQFRALVALSAYGTTALLPMNEKEAGEVCKLLLNRGGIELDQTEIPRFPSPLSISGDKIDADSLVILNSSIELLRRYNPFFQHAEGLSFACPISFGPEGGLTVGINKGEIACFSSILSDEGEKHLFTEYSFPKLERIQETGAGDAVAAVMALFNTVRPTALIAPHLLGNEETHRDLQHLASTVFVSCLSRIVGNLLIRTPMTNLAHIQIGPLGMLIREVAKESVELARKCWKLLPYPTFGVIEKWGIKVAIWVPRREITGTIG